MGNYKITVSEPWDFKGPVGENLIIGNIIKILTPQLIIFISDHLLNFEGQTGKILILKSRYEKQYLNKGSDYGGTIGGSLLLVDDYEHIDEKHIESNSKYVIIGNLSKK